MVQRIWIWYNNLPNRNKTSITCSITIVGLIATMFTVMGVSINGLVNSIWLSVIIVVAALLGVYFAAYWIIGEIYRDSVSMVIQQTSVTISCGDIFATEGFRVIGCDTHFDTRVDDIVISKKSLHGQLVLEHGMVGEINKLIEDKAKQLKCKKNRDGLYDFPLGTVIRYDSSKDKQTYLLLAMTENRKYGDKYKSYTTMAKYENMLMCMWKEIDGVYAYNDVVLPLLGTGISRFENGPMKKDALLRCMLCTLSSSGVILNSSVKIIIHGDAKDIPLYEYKDMFRSVQGR